MHCYFPKLRLDVMCIHFAIMQKKELSCNQTHFLKNVLKKSKRAVVLGDFNKRYREIKDDFSDFALASGEIKTCSLTPIMKFFHYHDDDHILIKGLNVNNLGFLEGDSDHRLIYSDFD